MRILHVPHAYPPVRGGTELLCQRVSESLAARGHQVRVVTADVGDVAGYYQFGVRRVPAGRAIVQGVEVLRVPYGGWLYSLGSRRFAQPALHRALAGPLWRLIRGRFRLAIQREIAAHRPDVVLTLPHLVINVQCVLHAQRQLGFPLVVAPLIHDDWPESVVRQMGAALSQAAAVVAATDGEAARLATEFGVPPERVFTAGMGVDLPPAVATAPRPPHVLFLGRKVRGKGIPDLLAAMHRVWRERPDATLVLAGSRTPATAEIDRLLTALPAAEQARIRSLDNVTEGEKTRLLSTARCLVLPSRAESFGLVLLEAMAHATPVVALDLPVFRSVVTLGVDGVLAAPDAPDSLAGAILCLLNDPVAATAMGERARQTVAHRFTWEQVAARYEAAYTWALAGRA